MQKYFAFRCTVASLCWEQQLQSLTSYLERELTGSAFFFSYSRQHQTFEIKCSLNLCFFQASQYDTYCTSEQCIFMVANPKLEWHQFFGHGNKSGAPFVDFSPQMCFPDLGNHLAGFLQRLWVKTLMIHWLSFIRERNVVATCAWWEYATWSMSAASLRRWAISSDSVSRSLRRPDLYSCPTSSLWRLSFTWLTRKCITAFGTLQQWVVEGKQTEQMENKAARWPGDCVVPQKEGLEFDPPGGWACCTIELS